MNIEVIVLAILLGLAIIINGVVSVVQVITNSKDRKELEKMVKASSLQEYTMYQPEEKEEEEVEDDRYVSLEDIGSVIGEEGALK